AQHPLGIGRAAHLGIRQDELAEGRVVVAVPDLRLAIAGRLGIDVAVEERLGRRDSSGPKTAARDFAAVCFARDAIRQARNSSGMLRRFATGEKADGEIEAPPPEMDGARLAGEARAEALK